MQLIEFGTDGVRGTAGEWPMDIAGASRIGLGVGRYLHETAKKPRVVIGRDTRLSCDMLFAALSAGLMAYGVDVVDAGMITTAAVAYLTRQHGFDIGIVISASHNPWTENGIKVIGPDGFKPPADLEATIQEHINLAAPDPALKQYGRITRDESLLEDYVHFLVAPFQDDPFDRLHVVIDCANGAASNSAAHCFAMLGSKVTVLHDRPDGTNINVSSGSEVARESRGDLAPTVLRESAHLGVAFDGDADRAVFIDERGSLVDGDHVLYILGTHLDSLGKLHGKTVVTTQMANHGLTLALADAGIQTIHTKVGDKYVVRELRANNYRLGGEQSGHIIIYDDEHTTGDGIYTALFLCHVLLQQPTLSLSALASSLTKLPQVIASAQVASKPGLDSLDDFLTERAGVLDRLGEGTIINTRYSGTEPLFRVMIQGTADHSLNDITRQAIQLCRVVQSLTGDATGRLEVKDCTTGASIDISSIHNG